MPLETRNVRHPSNGDLEIVKARAPAARNYKTRVLFQSQKPRFQELCAVFFLAHERLNNRVFNRQRLTVRDPPCYYLNCAILALVYPIKLCINPRPLFISRKKQPDYLVLSSIR